ncbi:LysR family transcriptional regulator [Rhodococcus tukisamuensis]|uniref:DNA-binding transcriptional regulator, LysR family n=1 Tax=Rhodococcus tukisamuensis TaxID=168276 RepID=A0A1G6W617_9NOCA|nr:LysR substrate-binding domain-containing protein [Rhodococcus tukisamuensis]SDD61279.1 DNA-binding transcriptional regulator, LysR family [Rhodococcus tukisamuensis]
MELQTRQLRYFVAVAEELSFTRAAQRLHIAQQALSAQIKQLEQSLGVVLLTRTTRSVTLTPAGAAFLDDTSALLAALDDAAERARSMDRSENERLVLGFTEGAALILTEPIMSAFRDRHPGVTIEMRQFNYDNPSAGLNDRSVDVAFVRRPLTTDGVEFEHLFNEPLVAMVRADHPLARKESVRAAELLEEPMFGAACTDSAWNEYWELDEHRSGTRAPIVSRSTTLLEEYQKVAAGVGIGVTVACSRWVPYPGVTLLPITDAEPNEVTVAWPRENDSVLVRSFIDAARRVRDARPDLVKRLQEPDLNERTMPTLIPY